MKGKNLETYGFQNEYGWMEEMKGAKWKQLLQTYKEDYTTHLKKAKTLSDQFEQELQLQPSYTKPVSLGSYEYEMRGFQTVAWRKKGSEKEHFAGDLDIDGEWIWTAEDKSNGAEQFHVCCYKKGASVWHLKKSVGPFVATVGKRCYAIELENFLWHRRVISVDAETGKDLQVELEMDDPRWNLQLIKGANECLFFVANNAGAQRCWYRTAEGAVKELKGFTAFVPVGFHNKKPCFFGRKEGSDSYSSVNCTVKLGNEETPEYFDPNSQLLITKEKGKRTVSINSKTVVTVTANVDVDTLPSWRQGGKAQITVAQPGSYRQTLEDFLQQKLCPYAKLQYQTVKSKDGTIVPYLLVSSCKPNNLLCIVYGAYGVPTRMNTDRWKPLLDRGWGLCFALVRGGGDHTDAWAEAARRDGKIKSIEDYEACIQAAQSKFHVKPSQTFLYGRSAGGYTVGSTLSRNSDGSLFAGVYTEVPYVDVLNTTSNPKLPLTRLEYNEFGDPYRIQNAIALVKLSPMDSLPATGAPNVFVLTRTAENDKEVYAYESVKWITKLRDLQGSKGKPKLLALEENEGHFSTEKTGVRQRADDMALLHFWLTHKKSHQGIYNMANTRRNRRNTRKNNVAMRKRRNNVTMGGKRRRAGTKGKGRKGTRRH